MVPTACGEGSRRAKSAPLPTEDPLRLRFRAPRQRKRRHAGTPLACNEDMQHALPAMMRTMEKPATSSRTLIQVPVHNFRDLFLGHSPYDLIGYLSALEDK